jgi:2-amino-4-hydroxy-6-hydroxymethyldihydropteridine diphosphokinase
VARGYLGLGSNVGYPPANLRAALAELARRRITPRRSSSLYDTEPVGLVLDQPRFLNACLEVDTGLEPEAVLDACKAVEQAVGRQGGGPRHGPRVIDVDVLLLGDRTLSSPRLTIPHPELTARRFVLVPLLELDPELTLPDGTPLSAALMALGPGQDVRRVGEPLLPGTGG